MSRTEVKLDLPVDYQLVNPGCKELVICLHGFAQSASILMHKLKGGFPDDATLLAVNGPFPLPERKSGGFDVRYAWYFYDHLKEAYLIDYRPAVSMIHSLVKHLGFELTPKRIVGYSQGGYLAPFVAESLQGVKQVVGVSSHYLKDEMRTPVSYRLDALHGEKDDVVDCAPARASHLDLLSAGMVGEFRVLKDETHRLTASFPIALKEILTR